MYLLRELRMRFQAIWPSIVLAALMLLVASSLIGCKAAGVNTPGNATAPADPYASALGKLQVFAQVLTDAQAAADGLHTTYVVAEDGTSATILDDAAYARVQAALRLLAAEGTTLSNLLAARTPGPVIATEMAKVTTELAANLSPASVGVKNPQAQQRYVVLVNMVNAGVRTLAASIALLPSTESRLERSRSTCPDQLCNGLAAVAAEDPRTGTAGAASVAAAGPVQPA